MAVRVYRSLDEVPADFPPSVITIGNFDGVHAGHRAILRRVVSIARENGWASAVLTFDPHPARIVAPDRAPLLMTTVERRAGLMEQEGIEHVLILPFTPEMAGWKAEFFVEHIISQTLHARAVLVGEGFRFGKRQSGDTELLRTMGGRDGFTVEVVKPVTRRGQRVSSSRLRAEISAGHMARAWRMLCTPFALEGTVVSGHGIGSRQTVPTLNLQPDTDLLPATGVYVTRTTDLDTLALWPSVTNIGTRPTFDGDALTIETFLLSPLTGATPRRIRVELLHRLRNEQRFASPEALKQQIFQDVKRAQTWLRRARASKLPGFLEALE